VRLYCGNSRCVRAGLLADGVNVPVERLLVQDLCHGSPAEDWCRHHVLAKILEGSHYELHLQVLMQLAVLLKHGGVVQVEPGAYTRPPFSST